LTTTYTGLSSEEAKCRLAKYGPNKLIEIGGVSPLRIFMNQFRDVFVLMLLAAIAISLLSILMKAEPATLEDYADAMTIGVIVVLNASVGFVQEYRSEKAMGTLKKYASPKARVMRDEHEIFIPAEEVVPGDILILESGG